MKRGSICWINLGDSAPPESGKTRPGVIVSNSIQNEILDSVVVIPLSTTPGEIWPLRVKLGGPPRKTSFAVLPGLRQVSKTRLLDPVGLVPPVAMRHLDEALAVYLND